MNSEKWKNGAGLYTLAELTARISPQYHDSLKSITKASWERFNEGLYLGEIDPNIITWDGVFSQVVKDGFSNWGKITHDIDPNKFEFESALSGGLHWELYLKLCWLSDILITNGKFDNALGCHYNPKSGIHVIHPGGTRQRAFCLFPSSKVEVLYFNTTGKQFDFLNNLEKVSIDTMISRGWFFNVVADHGSLIPHMMKDTRTISSRKKDYFSIVDNNLKKLKIKSNIIWGNINWFKKYIDNKNPNCLLEWKTNYDEKEYNSMRIAVLCALRKDYENEYFKITFQNSVE